MTDTKMQIINSDEKVVATLLNNYSNKIFLVKDEDGDFRIVAASVIRPYVNQEDMELIVKSFHKKLRKDGVQVNLSQDPHMDVLEELKEQIAELKDRLQETEEDA